jgi:hypothetical protein
MTVLRSNKSANPPSGTDDDAWSLTITSLFFSVALQSFWTLATSHIGGFLNY